MTPDPSSVEAFFSQNTSTPIEQLFLPETQDSGVNLWLKRDDLVHDRVSGNKFRKLKYNALHACETGNTRLLSFGGAYSNHIYALAALGAALGFETVGLIRGEELDGDNPTLAFAQQCGMKLHFISRDEYRRKTNPEFIEKLRMQLGDFYLIPEGGTNDKAIRGCAELSREIRSQIDADFLCVACGTGGTIAGLITGADVKTRVLGYPALKGADFLTDEVQSLIPDDNATIWELVHDYHFGGYARINKQLVDFMRIFHQQSGVQLDPIYTAKMLFGVIDMIKNGFFPEGSDVVAIHTGGLQGLDGKRQEMARFLGEL